MINENFYYQESKKVNPIGLALSYVLVFTLVFFLGYLYTLLIIFIPIIYFNFLLTIGFGFTVGFINKILFRITHNRHKKSQLIQALISGILANYFQWTVYILYAFTGKTPSFSEYLSSISWIAMPKTFFNIIAEINRVGLWSIFGITFNGFVLDIIWVFEALIIISLPLIVVYKSITYPYSESLNRWYPKYTLSKDFEYIAAVKKLIKDLQLNALSAIHDLGNGNGNRYSKIHIYYFKDEDKQYLTFENIFIEQKGKGKTQSNIIINNFAIDKNTAESIIEKFENKKERIVI